MHFQRASVSIFPPPFLAVCECLGCPTGSFTQHRPLHIILLAHVLFNKFMRDFLKANAFGARTPAMATSTATKQHYQQSITEFRRYL